MVMKTGRNDPCPCGSGKKYKRCCLNLKTPVSRFISDPKLRMLREAEGKVVGLALSYARKVYGVDFLEVAWDEYSPDGGPMMDAPEFDTSFIPWALFNFVPEEVYQISYLLDGLPVAELLLSQAEFLDEYERAVMWQISDQPCSFFVVQSVDPGAALTLLDIFTLEEFVVKERRASMSLKPGTVIYTRIISVEDTSIMVGLSCEVFPPAVRRSLIDLREEVFGVDSKVERDELHMCDELFRITYFDLKHHVPEAPELENYNFDGELVVPITLSYELRCSPHEAFEKLCSLSIFDAGSIKDGAEYAQDGGLLKASFTWMVECKTANPVWINAVLGKIEIDGEQLTIGVDSRERAERIESEVEKRLGGDAVLTNWVEESIADLQEKRFGREEPEQERKREEENQRIQALPEMQEQVKETVARYYELWVDQPVPSLRGKTPREAAKTPVGRELLETLLAEIEHMSSEIEDILRPDIKSLRKRLG